MVTSVSAEMVKQFNGLQADNGLEVLGVGSPQQLGHLLQQVGNADGCDQNSQGRGFAQGAVGHTLHGNAQNGTHHHGQQHRHNGVEPERAECKKDHIAANHDDIAMGEVQHFSDTINHGITQCDQRVHTAQADAIDQIG